MERDAMIQARARRAYEIGRARHALVAAIPTLVVTLVACLMSERGSVPLLGAGLFAAAALFHWRGRDLARGVLPGAAAGLIPFSLAHAARLYGHVCTGDGCMSLCMPACLCGGLIAGFIVGRVAARSERRAPVWASAGLVAALTGSLACACVGFGGVMGLVAGLLVGSVPQVLRPATAR